MNLYILLCVLLISSLNSSSCGLQPRKLTTSTGSPQNYSDTVLRHVDTVLNGDAKPPANLSEMKVEGAVELRNVQFIDADNGWAANKDFIYKTSDAGRTWEQLTINLPPNSQITSFFFVNSERGWLASVAVNDAGRYGLGHSSCLMTTDDGGKKWVVRQSLADEINVQRIEFFDENKGFAIGNKVIDSKPAYTEVFAAGTTDGGKTWTNISERVNSVIKNKYGIANDDAADIYQSASSRIFLLTRLGRVVTSFDGGDSWRLDMQIEGERSQTSYVKISSVNDGSFKILAKETGDEGYRGNLIVKDGQDSFISYDLTRTSIFDAVFLSDQEIIACGVEIQSAQRGNSIQSAPSPVGIVLHSADGGKTWSILYRSKSSRAFVSMSNINDRFYVIGSAGTLLKFTL